MQGLSIDKIKVGDKTSVVKTIGESTKLEIDMLPL
ncbi:hypothetical protein BCM20_001676 [Clostridium beijerinckii]|nr:hypothetical protein [Clostridium beijerinckii]NRT72808.1 hypothetical protein [Clostridium beijerinckii]NYC01721.1 hypothetical protein [Clostridium beijerinckii]